MIAKVLTKISLHSKQNDLAYWKSQSIEERISMVEDLRREVHGEDYEQIHKIAPEYRIVKLKAGK